MKVSVVIPVYNNSRTIVSALDSVFHQSNTNIIHEIIVVNDGSTDDSQEVLTLYAKQPRTIPVYIIHQCNGGASAARNAGMRAATGDWIALLDADDEWLPNKLELQSEYIRNNDSIDFLGGNYTDKPLRIMLKKITVLHKASIRELCIKWFPVTPSVLFRKEIIEDIGGFNEDMRHAEDGEFFTRICANYGYYYMPEKIVSIGHGKKEYGESGLSSNLKEMYRGNVEIFQKLRQNEQIGQGFYLFVRAFALLKHFRRVLFTNFRISRQRGR